MTTNQSQNYGKQLREDLVRVPLNEVAKVATSNKELWNVCYHDMNMALPPYNTCKGELMKDAMAGNFE